MVGGRIAGLRMIPAARVAGSGLGVAAVDTAGMRAMPVLNRRFDTIWERYRSAARPVGSSREVDKLGRLQYFVAFERGMVQNYPVGGTNAHREFIVGTREQAAEIAVKMADRPGAVGGTVIIAVHGWSDNDPTINVEPGDSKHDVIGRLPE